MLDLRRADVRAMLGVELGELTGPRGRAQPLAGRARAIGAEGMIVPSAAHDGHWNLVIFPGGLGRITRRTSRAQHPAPPAA